VTGLDGTTGTVAYETAAVGAEDLDVWVVLRDASGEQVALRDGPSGVLTVRDVHRWAPGDGYLYDLEVQLVDGERVVDSYHQPVGIRTIEVRGAEFLVNGRTGLLQGFRQARRHRRHR
jgi:beta-glucuronidase